MKIFIHIGTHKTGTTSIQNILFSNKDELKNKNILYPSSGCTNTKAHHNLVYQSAKSWKYKEAFGGWRELENEVSRMKPESVVLSAENFSGYFKNKKVIDDIKSFCESIEATPVIVACIRPQVDYIDSIYSQNCATGYEKRKYAEYVMESLSDPAFDFESILGRWFDEFSDVRLIDYTEFSENGLNPFFKAIECDFASEYKAKEEEGNARRTSHVVEFCRKANDILSEVKDIGKEDKHRIILNIGSGVDKKFPDSPKFKGVDKKWFKVISSAFETKNREFFNKRNGGTNFFKEFCINEAFYGDTSLIDYDRLDSNTKEQFMVILSKSIFKR